MTTRLFEPQGIKVTHKQIKNVRRIIWNQKEKLKKDNKGKVPTKSNVGTATNATLTELEESLIHECMNINSPQRTHDPLSLISVRENEERYTFNLDTRCSSKFLEAWQSLTNFINRHNGGDQIYNLRKRKT